MSEPNFYKVDQQPDIPSYPANLTTCLAALKESLRALGVVVNELHIDATADKTAVKVVGTLEP